MQHPSRPSCTSLSSTLLLLSCLFHLSSPLLLLPSISYTVPNPNLGWKAADGTWHDANGPRSGPPMNYWRQSSDERQYNAEMSFAVSALSGSPDFGLLPRSTINRPLLNRKLLTTWSPLILSGSVVSSPSPAVPASPGPTPTCSPRISYVAPFTMKLSRPHGRVLGPKNHYGQFDAHLSPGEVVRVSFLGLPSCAGGAEFEAGVENGVSEVGVFEGVKVKMGGITYLSDYLMVGEGGVWVKTCVVVGAGRREEEEEEEEFLPWEANGGAGLEGKRVEA